MKTSFHKSAIFIQITQPLKDNFSHRSEHYAKFRPHYPEKMFDFILQHVPCHKRAWDVGTGNGQVAGKLAQHFEQVMATDISENQLRHAVQRSNIFYKSESAEHSSFADANFDLITVGQAIHWFNFDAFYQEVRRTSKQGGIIAVIGYPLFHVSKSVDALIWKLYSETLQDYWDPERRYLDEQYATLPFPFTEIESPAFEMQYDWTLDQLVGFLNTWSAVRHYIAKHGVNPVDSLDKELQQIWTEDEKKKIYFPVLLKLGRII